jgi:hypothetical protein
MTLRLRPILGLAALAIVAATPANATTTPTQPSLPARPELPPAERVLLFVDGAERWVAADAAVAAGYTLVDLSDTFTPFIFRETTDATGNVLFNRYRRVYLGLANDSGDGDGQPLAAGAHNYLELYGVPPTLSVLRARFVGDEVATAGCATVDFDKLRAAPSIPPRDAKAQAKMAVKVAAEARQLEKQRVRAGVDTLDALAEKEPATAKLVAEVQLFAVEKLAFPEVEKRLTCEGLLEAPGTHNRKSTRERHNTGQFDEAMRQAVVAFQHKQMLYDAAALRKQTMLTLGKPLLDNDYAAFMRVLTERVVSAAGILEDGTVEGTYTNSAGQTVPIRNMVGESMAAVTQQAGWATPADVLAFFKRHAVDDLATLRVGFKLPSPPEYYAAMMDLSVLIDRGDVIYDPPFDADGKPSKLSRHHFPQLTLRVRYNNQTIPLVHWRTTIGGWRSDLAANGYEYYRYKGSDIGPRVWRNIVSGPVWIAPPSTPVRTLVKWKNVHGTTQEVVNYDEVGPGYLSAYGLVAAYNVVPGKNGAADWDNGVRVHGSSEILSIRDPDAYSHGCHRLMNNLAVRLFSFVLGHRTMVVEGDKSLDFARSFLWKADVFELRLPSRGFWYRLEPPLPVNVLEGNIIGDVKKPITTYVAKPGVVYPPGPMPVPKDSPEARAGGAD